MPLGETDADGTVEGASQNKIEGAWCPQDQTGSPTSHLPSPTTHQVNNDTVKDSSRSDDIESDVSVGCPSPLPQRQDVSDSTSSATDQVVEKEKGKEEEDKKLISSSTPSSSDQTRVKQDSNSILLSGVHESTSCPEDEYFKPLKRLRMVELENPNQEIKVPIPGVKSFSISDILSHNPVLQEPPQPCLKIVRPWDINGDEMSISSGESSAGSPRPSSSGAESRGGTESEGEKRSRGRDGNPLDALFQMTSKTFDRSKSGLQTGKPIFH